MFLTIAGETIPMDSDVPNPPLQTMFSYIISVTEQCKFLMSLNYSMYTKGLFIPVNFTFCEYLLLLIFTCLTL